MKCIIPCAGESSRMSYVPKMLIRVKGKPLLSHIIDFWKEEVDSFIFVVRRKDIFYWEYLPENSAVVFQDSPEGLANAILRAEPYVSGRFIVALGDCLYKGKFKGSSGLGAGVWRTRDINEVRKSYLVTSDNARILCVEEKPRARLLPEKVALNCGMGAYFLDTRVFQYIRESEVEPSGGDFTSILQSMIDRGEVIAPVWFRGRYVNVGSPEDIEKAEKVLK